MRTLISGKSLNQPGAGRPRRSYYSDVWSTKDGVRWEVAANEPPFSARIWHNVKAFDGRIWLINGYDGDMLGQGRLADNREDVWYSVDGKNFELSYPYLLEGPDGAIHVAYTYFRRAIKYVRLPAGWIDGDES